MPRPGEPLSVFVRYRRHRLYVTFGVEENQESVYTANTLSWRMQTPLFKYQGAPRNLKRHLCATSHMAWQQEKSGGLI
jgi:hypothetical protein